MDKKELGELLQQVSESLLAEYTLKDENIELKRIIRVLLINYFYKLSKQIQLFGDTEKGLTILFNDIDTSLRSVIDISRSTSFLTHEQLNKLIDDFMERIKTQEYMK